MPPRPSAGSKPDRTFASFNDRYDSLVQNAQNDGAQLLEQSVTSAMGGKSESRLLNTQSMVASQIDGPSCVTTQLHSAAGTGCQRIT